MTEKQLREYCEAEFENIEAVLAELRAVVPSGPSGHSVVELAAIGTFLHNFHNGVENVLKRILSFKAIALEKRPTWHKDLLYKCTDIGVLPPALRDTLSAYLSFRHFFVHAYSFALRWEDMEPLVNAAGETLNEFRAVVMEFVERAEKHP